MATSRVLSGLAVVGALTSTLATMLIWTMLTDPTTMATALGQGSVRLVLAAIIGVH